MHHFLRALLSAVCLWGSGAQAQSGDTIRIIVPFAAGGPADQIARTIAQPLAAQLG